MAAIDVDIVAMITLMIALLGWCATYYHQRRIINKQAKRVKPRCTPRSATMESIEEMIQAKSNQKFYRKM